MQIDKLLEINTYKCTVDSTAKTFLIRIRNCIIIQYLLQSSTTYIHSLAGNSSIELCVNIKVYGNNIPCTITMHVAHSTTFYQCNLIIEYRIEHKRETEYCRNRLIEIDSIPSKLNEYQSKLLMEIILTK